MKLIKKIFSNTINFINKYKYIIYMSIPFILMDIITRLIGYKINFINYITPNIFTLLYIFLFVGITLSLRKKTGKILYIIFNIFFLTIFLTNNIYYSMTKSFFDFNLLESASEGTPYIIDTILNAPTFIYLLTILIGYTMYLGYKKIPYKTKNNYKYLSYIILIFIILHILTPITLGKSNKELTWSSWKNPRNVYESFNDTNKSIKISGLYEYTVRNFYVTFLKQKVSKNQEDELFLETAFNEEDTQKNKYTGIFKDKNLILIQLEGMDNWVINDENTKTLSKLMKESINFKNHFSYYNGGGSTFNSEFAVNTGFITPLSYTQNAYTFNKNSFPYSLANLFKKEEYTVNAFHMNTGEYYSRKPNYKNWGYDNYYGLADLNEYTDKSYNLDRELILNETFNNLLFNTESKFVDYLITYSLHMPFNSNKGVCKQLLDLEKKEQEENNENIDIEVSKEEDLELTELDCIKLQANETDYMVELLLKNLEEKKLLDNTVLVFFTDHYLYTIEDKTILDKYKETSNNLINKTPFFIWSKDIKQTEIKEVTSQLNILPTILNLFGIEDYNKTNYIGKDALNPNYKGIVFFSDYSWYDGKYYVENGEVKNQKPISEDLLEEKNYYINYITRKNDLALKYNYYKKLNNK